MLLQSANMLVKHIGRASGTGSRSNTSSPSQGKSVLQHRPYCQYQPKVKLEPEEVLKPEQLEQGGLALGKQIRIFCCSSATLYMEAVKRVKKCKEKRAVRLDVP